jgi:hypothetical protein
MTIEDWKFPVVVNYIVFEKCCKQTGLGLFPRILNLAIPEEIVYKISLHYW